MRERVERAAAWRSDLYALTFKATATAEDIAGWRTRLQGLLAEAPLAFTPSDSFDGDKGFQLKPKVQEKHEGQEFGLMVGTHLGTRLPPSSQIRACV
ncbi:hypothetical protein CRUP_037638 [Coryphaenoides rupestris]|nr:hypothetical protein CRUP_037638 [Coryphaenoides rupestris]